MIRKWLTMFLAITLAVMIPFAAIADKQHTASVELGDMLSSDEAIKDLLDTLAVRITKDDENGALALLLNQKEIVSIGLSVDHTGLYLESGLMGEKVVYISWDDGFSLLSELMAASAAETGIDEEVLQGMEISLSEMKNGLIEAIEKDDPVAMFTPAQMQENLEVIEEIFPDDPGMVQYIKGIYEDASTEQGSFSSENRDSADQKHHIVIDEQDLLVLGETKYLERLMRETLSAEMPEASEAELDETYNELMAQFKKALQESDFEMIMESYTVNHGKVLVGLDFLVNMTILDGDQRHAIQMTSQYDRLKNDKGTSYHADGKFAVDAEGIEFTFDLLQNRNRISKGMLGVLVDGEEMVITYNAEPVSGTRVRRFDLYLRSGASAILEPAENDRPFITVHALTENAPEETLAALKQATPDNSLNLLKLSDEELITFGEQITTNAVQTLYAALAELPTSTLNLLLNSGMVE